MVILIIAILVTLAVPQYKIMREKAITAEAVKVVGMLKRERENQNVGEEHPWPNLPQVETDKWSFHHGISYAHERYIVVAVRKSGPYANCSIQFEWEWGGGNEIWMDTHPGTPGGATMTPP